MSVFKGIENNISWVFVPNIQIFSYVCIIFLISQYVISLILILEFLGLQFFTNNYSTANSLIFTANFISSWYIPKVELLNPRVWVSKTLSKYFPLNVLLLRRSLENTASWEP